MNDLERNYLEAIARESETHIKQLRFHRYSTYFFEGFAYILPALQAGTAWFVYSREGWTLSSIIVLCAAVFWSGVAVWLYVRNRELRADINAELSTQETILEGIRDMPELHDSLIEAIRESYGEQLGLTDEEIDARFRAFIEEDDHE